jgi:CRP-like cAMP-binding protein
MSNYHDYLRKVPLFASLDEDELDAVDRTATNLTYEAGRILVYQGRLAHEMFVVMSGTLEVTRDGEHVADIEAGGFAGEMALLAHSHRGATVTAKTDVSVVHIDGREFSNLLREVPQIAVKMLPVIAGRVEDTIDSH